METKNAIRTRHLQLRDQLPVEEKQHLDGILARKVLSGREYLHAEKLLTYVGFGSEVSTKEILLNALTHGKEVFVPKILPGRRMDFYPIHGMEDLVTGKQRIPEPVIGKSIAFAFQPRVPILILVPLVAFDGERNRIGYGGGYYDRYLAEIPPNIDVYTVGLAFELQKSARIPAEATDIKPQKIITELQTYEALQKGDLQIC